MNARVIWVSQAFHVSSIITTQTFIFRKLIKLIFNFSISPFSYILPSNKIWWVRVARMSPLPLAKTEALKNRKLLLSRKTVVKTNDLILPSENLSQTLNAEKRIASIDRNRPESSALAKISDKVPRRPWLKRSWQQNLCCKNPWSRTSLMDVVC